MRHSNPQGKGVVTLLQSWQAQQPTELRAKSPREILQDYLTGLLILSATFQFMPVVGRSYHLYWRSQEWRLSMISPAEWGERLTGSHVGECVLQADRSWAFTPTDNIGDNAKLVAALEVFQRGFLDLLQTDHPLQDNLPYYVARLPYYPRLLAASLAKSLHHSIAMLGASTLSGQAWLASVPPRALSLHSG